MNRKRKLSFDPTVFLSKVGTRCRKFALVGALCFPAWSPAFAQPLPPAHEAPFRSVAEEFIAAAAVGDLAKTASMISPDLMTSAGREVVTRNLAGEVLPFFAQYKELGKSTTITRTAGVVGFVFYMYMVSRTDELRPFVIYVVEEKGSKVVANVLVDQFVEGRHCTRTAGAWQCPDFR